MQQNPDLTRRVVRAQGPIGLPSKKILKTETLEASGYRVKVRPLNRQGEYHVCMDKNDFR